MNVPRRAVVLLACLLCAGGCGDKLGQAIGPAPDGGGGVSPTSAVQAVSVHGTGTACAAGNNAFYVRPSGESWSEVALGDADRALLQATRLVGIWCLSQSTFVAVGSKDTAPPVPRVAVVQKGQTWKLSLQSPVAQGDLFAVTPQGSTALMAVGYKLGTTGTTSLAISSADPVLGVWQEDTRLGGQAPLRSLWVRPDGERVAVGDSGTLFHGNAGTEPYTLEQNPLGAVTMRGVWAAGNQGFVAVGEGALLRRDASGAWRTMPSTLSSAVDWRGVHGGSDGDIYAIGGQTIAHWDGATWQEVTSVTGLPAVRDLRAVWVDTAAQLARLHLAGDKLLRTCAISAGAPPSLACGP